MGYSVLLLLVLSILLYTLRIQMKHPHLMRMAFRHFLHHKKRTFLTIAGIVVASTLMTSTFLIQGFLTTSGEQLVEQQLGPVVGYLPAVLQPLLEDSFFTQSDVERVKESLEAEGMGRVEVIPIVGVHVTLFGEGKPERERSSIHASSSAEAFILGVERDQLEQYAGWFGDELATSMERHQGMVLTQPLAEALRMEEGERLIVPSPEHTSLSLEVQSIVPAHGLLGYKGEKLSHYAALASIDALRHIQGLAERAYTTILLVSDKPYDSQAFMKMPSQPEVTVGGWRIVNGRQQVKHLFEAMTNIMWLFYMASAISVCISIILIANLLLMLMEERRREFGILRAIGLNRKDVTRLIRLEGVMYAGVAAGIGVGTGMVLANAVIQELQRILHSLFDPWVAFELQPFYVEWQSLLLGFSITVLAVFVCVWVLTRQSQRYTVIDLLQEGGLVLEEEWKGQVYRSLWLLMLLVVFVLFHVAFPLSSLIPNDISIIYLYMGLGFVLMVGATLFIFSSLELLVKLNTFLWKRKLAVVSVSRLVLRNLQQKKKRAVLLSLMFATVLFITSLSSMFSMNLMTFYHQVDEKTRGYDYRAVTDQQISTKDLEELLQQQPFGLGQERVAVSTLVEATLPEKFISVKGINQAFVESQALPLVARHERYASDTEAWQAILDNPELMVVSYLFQYNYERPLFIGDRYSFTLGGQVMEKEIIGLEGSNPYYEMMSMWMSEEALFDSLYTPDEVKQIVWFSSDEKEVDRDTSSTVLENLIRQLAPYGFTTWLHAVEVSHIFHRYNVSIYALFEGFSAIATFIGIAGLMVVMLRILHERGQQLGMLRAIGVSSHLLFWSVFMEGFFISFVGITVGMVLGVYTGYVMFDTLFVGITQFHRLVDFEYIFPISHLLYFYCLVIIFALLSSGVIASRIRKLSPVQGTRNVR